MKLFFGSFLPVSAGPIGSEGVGQKKMKPCLLGLEMRLVRGDGCTFFLLNWKGTNFVPLLCKK